MIVHIITKLVRDNQIGFLDAVLAMLTKIGCKMTINNATKLHATVN